MLRFLNFLVDLLLPRHPRASRALTVSHHELAQLLAPVVLPQTLWVHALFPYRSARVRELVQAVKYYGESELPTRVAPFARDYLLEVLADLTTLSGWENPILVPIASSPKRLRERGYNQAALFARAIATECSLPYAELLQKVDRQSQVHVPRTQRKKNIAHAFTAHDAAGKCIVLIDDVVESGATLIDARRALLAAGARDVCALVIAH